MSWYNFHKNYKNQKMTIDKPKRYWIRDVDEWFSPISYKRYTMDVGIEIYREDKDNYISSRIGESYEIPRRDLCSFSGWGPCMTTRKKTWIRMWFNRWRRYTKTKILQRHIKEWLYRPDTGPMFKRLNLLNKPKYE